MTQDDRWTHRWQEYIDFLHENKRRPSKYYAEERDLVNWAKHSRKLRNQDKLPDSRKAKFGQLLSEAAKYQRVNQHAYVDGRKTADNE